MFGVFSVEDRTVWVRAEGTYLVERVQLQEIGTEGHQGIGRGKAKSLC